MRFKIPGSSLEFDLPDDWWTAAGMADFLASAEHYPVKGPDYTAIVVVEEIEPPLRKNGEFWFRDRNSVVDVLRRIRAGEQIEPIEVWGKDRTTSRKYIVRDGFHRFYLSIAAGYRSVPVRVNNFDMQEFLRNEAGCE